MAELLKRQYDIVVLRVAMPNGARDDDVTFTLQAKVDGELRDLHHWPTTFAALGLGVSSESRPGQGKVLMPDLPAGLVETVRAFFRADGRPDRPLWVHMVLPSGTLRFVAWERVLGAAIGVPILMLPDFLFPPPLDTEAELEVLVCGSAPLGHEHWSVLDALRVTIRRISNSVDRPIHINVFADQQIADTLLEEWTGVPGFAEEVTVHDPADARPFAEEDRDEPAQAVPSGIRSPWLRWMKQTLKGRSIDVAHFVSHGYLSHGRGSLLFAQSPKGRTDRYLAGPVGAGELQNFLTAIGAWATSFVALSDNYSEPGLRVVIDDIAQSRPGPLVMHSITDDPKGDALSDAYGFLFGHSRRAPPVSPALLLYCQPYLVPSADPVAGTSRSRRRAAAPPADMPNVLRNDAQRMAASRAEDASSLEGVYESSRRVSAVVASTARFAEDVQLKYQQLARDEVAPAEQCNRDAALAQDTLDRLTTFVARRASTETPE